MEGVQKHKQNILCIAGFKGRMMDRLKIYNKVIKRVKCFVLGKPYIPQEMLRGMKGPLLLHISDTPSDIYNYIRKVIEEINPQYIVHTGDMVDNIKLEMNRERTEEYKKSFQRLVTMLETTSRAELFYVMGNHDNIDVVKLLVKRGHVLEKGIINIEGRSIYLNHYYNQKDTGITDYYLYGHSFEPHNHERDGMKGLNGTLKINVIDLSTNKVLKLNYPVDTNRLRKMENRKIGL